MLNLEKTFNCFEPEYIQNFSCEGEKCDAKCCRGFQIDLDRNTHTKYRMLQNSDVRKKILDSLFWNQETQTYRMKLDENFSCPMICDDNLCYIQKNLGEDFLADSCAVFPRRVFVIGNTITRTLSLFCPVAARLALIDSNPMRFRKILLKTTRSGAFFHQSISDMPARKFLLPLEKFAIEILQNRNFTLNRRLTILGIMMSMIDFKLENLSAEVLEDFGAKFHSEDFFARMNRNFSIFQFDKKAHIQIMFQLMDELFGKAIIYYSEKQRNFARYVPQAFGMADRITKSSEEVLHLYEENFAAYDKFVRQRYPQFMENYFVHNFVAGLYPCRVQSSLTENYFLFATICKFFEFGLICMAGVERENLRLEDILEFAGRFSHRVDHGWRFQYFVINYVQKLLPYSNEFLNALIDFDN